MDVNGNETSGNPKKGTPPAKTEGKPPAKQADSIGAMIEKLKPQLAKALPKHVTPERLARVALTAIRNNPKLAAADAMSLMGSIMTAAQLGLEPNTPLGQCYIIPYADNKRGVVNAQFQMGYKGIVDLAHRTAQYRNISAHAVDEADVFEYEYGIDTKLIHKPADKPSGKVIYYYGVYHLTNGGHDFRVWSKDKIMDHAAHYSKSWDKTKKKFAYGSAWADNFDSMACKTVLIDLLRYAPKSVEIAQAAGSDNMAFKVDFEDPDLNLDTVETEFQVEE